MRVVELLEQRAMLSASPVGVESLVNTATSGGQLTEIGGGSSVNALALQPDGKIIVGGSFVTLRPNGAGSYIGRTNLARLHADGTVDMGFDCSVSGSVNGLALQPDGRIVLGGSFSSQQPRGIASVTRNRAARINADSSIDMSFDPSVPPPVKSVAVLPGGRILVGGAVTITEP